MPGLSHVGDQPPGTGVLQEAEHSQASVGNPCASPANSWVIDVLDI
jgi:hypothetical protein